ncbi:MAG: hypothetical protein AABX27_03225 [Nanoarchaeota archaeon]|mgnify:FL=1
MNRKGSYDISRKTLYFILVLFVLAFIFIYMAGTINKYYGISMDERDAVMAHIMSSEAIFSRWCFAYYDESTGRAYPGFIDADKFKKPLNPSCLRYADVPFAFYLNPDSQDKQVISEGPLLEDTDTVKRYVLGIKNGMPMQVNPSLMLEFNDYYLRQNQKTQATGEEMSRAMYTAGQATEEVLRYAV